MHRSLFSLAILPFMAGIANAGHPTHLNDQQMDRVVAGTTETSGDLSLSPASPTTPPSYGLLLFFLNETDVTNTGTVIVNESPVPCSSCYLNIGQENLVIEAAFGPMRTP